MLLYMHKLKLCNLQYMNGTGRGILLSEVSQKKRKDTELFLSHVGYKEQKMGITNAQRQQDGLTELNLPRNL